MDRRKKENVEIVPRLSYLQRGLGATPFHVAHTLITRLVVTLYPKVPRQRAALRSQCPGAIRAMRIMIEGSREYMAYLVRIWPVRTKGQTLWHVALENAHTGERRGFASLDDLFDYLRVQAEAGMASKEVKPDDTV